MKILLIVIVVVISLGIIFWLLWKKSEETCTKILITNSFKDLEVGRTAVFRAGETIRPGDSVLIDLPGYKKIWRVRSIRGQKLDLYYLEEEELIGFPLLGIKGKFMGYDDEDWWEDIVG